jgi:glycerol-3-phosphate O-acyltransferase
LVVVRESRGVFVRRPAPDGSRTLARLLREASTGNAGELLLVPVAIYWGRSPDRERSWFRLLFSENWELIGRTRKFLMTIVHGRSTLLRYSNPLNVGSIVVAGSDPALAVRKV